MNFPTLDFSTPDLALESPGLRSLGLKSSWLKSLGLKSLGLKCLSIVRKVRGLFFLNCLETTELSVESLTITASASKDLFLNLLIYSQNSIHF